MYFFCKRHEKWIIGAINSRKKRRDSRKMDAIFGDPEVFRKSREMFVELLGDETRKCVVILRFCLAVPVSTTQDELITRGSIVLRDFAAVLGHSSDSLTTPSLSRTNNCNCENR